MPNRLAQEKSPYLLQHAENPVDWYPWGDDAFERARGEGKPIFLSIGYSTCHWCHVMAHESFESREIADLLNEHFVSIKVDREERPDVDRVYMTYVQALSGHGGWPLSVWLTGDLKPFYGGTYFPPEDRHGRPGFGSLLRAISDAWKRDRAKLLMESERVIETLEAHREEQRGASSAADATQELSEAAGEAFEKCFQYFYESFDPVKGGFGSAPKFPRASNLNFIFRVAAIQGMDTEAGAEAVRMASLTLQRMAEGGIHDHVGGGFHRYSVDDSWFVPHFEKMLYDQAQIATNYLEGFQATGREAFLWVARDVYDYVLRDLVSEEGGFVSAEDADSLIEDGKPGHAEGAYYVWTRPQMAAALADPSSPVDLAELVAHHFGVKAEGDVPSELDPHQEFQGKNILMQRHSLVETAVHFGIEPQLANDLLVGALTRLRGVRARRPRPHLDDKIITAWNGLMISSLARGAQALEATDLSSANDCKAYVAAAVRAAEFLQRELFDSVTGQLRRCYRLGAAPIGGFAEDYAYLIQGLIDLYEVTFQVRWLEWAEALQTTLDDLFWDDRDGGYFNSRTGDASIVLRLKEDYDGAEPAPSSVAAMNLLRLAPISAKPEERIQQALRTLQALRPQWSRLPHALPQALCALEYALIDRQQVVLAGDPSSASFRALWRETQRGLGPKRAIFAADGAEGQAWLGRRAVWIRSMSPDPSGQARAYVCDHYACREPVSTPEALRSHLSAAAS
ncbi:thioredoxin domain-containing protein [Opitutaceae bacterium EW11]|nr:thioredoxin domain-containing protein [Opitutaceae bacterium EW11]